MTPRDTIAAAKTISAHTDPMQAARAVMEMIEPKPLVWRRYRRRSGRVGYMTYGVDRQRYYLSGSEGSATHWEVYGDFGKLYVDGDHNAAMKAADADNLVRFWASTSVGGGE